MNPPPDEESADEDEYIQDVEDPATKEVLKLLLKELRYLKGRVKSMCTSFNNLVSKLNDFDVPALKGNVQVLMDAGVQSGTVAMTRKTAALSLFQFIILTHYFNL